MNDDDKKLRLAVHTTIKKVTADCERFSFNTAISSVMEMVNALYVYKEKVNKENYNKSVITEALESLVILLCPFVPHISSELWELMGKETDITSENWLKYDDNALVVDEIEIVLQINGKIRDKLKINPDMSPDEMKELALESEKIQELIDGKEIVKCIAVPKKMINIVVKG